MRLRSLRDDERGATLVEFALISPVLLLTILGLFEMGYNYYIQAQLQGAGKRHPPLPLARPSSAEAASCRGTGVTAGQVAPRRTSSQPSSDLKKCSMV